MKLMKLMKKKNDSEVESKELGDGDDEEMQDSTQGKKTKRKKPEKAKKISYKTLFRKNEKDALKIPYLDMDYAKVADRLTQLAERKKVVCRSSKNVANGVARKFRSLANGVYPLVLNLPSSGSELDDSDIDEAVDRLHEFNDELLAEEVGDAAPRRKGFKKMKKGKN